MKRALKKRVKAVLNNTPNSDDAPVEQLNEANPKATRRTRTQAAMIGLAISMGATSLLVTRQSDQAQAAAPVGSQKAASTIPAAAETEIKFVATKLESQAVSSASVPENPVIVEPTAVSQVPGLEAKWPITAKEKAVKIPVSEADKNAIYLQPQIAPELRNNSVQSTLQTANQLPQTSQQFAANPSVVGSQPTPVTVQTENTISNDVNVQLKAQQEFALNRLQEKSNRLRNSLAELRSEEANNLSQSGIEQAQPTTVADQTVAVQSEDLTKPKQVDLISKLKEDKNTSALEQKVMTPAPAAPTVVAQLPLFTYEVKPGDTLAEIATNYGTSVSELVKANNLNNPNELQISQKLIIPAVKAERSLFDQPTVAIQPNFVQPSSMPTVASSPVSKPKLDTNLTVGSQSPVFANNNSVAIPIPAARENQLSVNTPAITNSITIPVPAARENQLPTPDTEATPPRSYGVGGDTPIRNRATTTQTAQKPPRKLAKAKGNERLTSLQAEIERLREKYRAQQSGMSQESTVTVPTVTETDNSARPIAVQRNKNVSAVTVNSQLNSVAIPVPQPILPSYSEKPVKPLFRATRPTNEPINPEFLSNQTAAPKYSNRNSSGIRLAVPPAGVTATESLGKLRGTRVSPTLPPLASVDIYLPRSVDPNTNSPSTSSTGYIWPAKGVLSSGYGWRWGRMHRGIDIANGVGTPIYASAPGVVEKAGWNNGGYGILVEIRHADGSMTRYAHNSRVLVQVGQQVEQGQTIAAMGSTGFSTGPHSHFEVHPSGKGAVNPIAFLPARL
ncbi:peptidoglycan DD-metalloendopeptidase family protein [Anabaena lutea FACHB-196]|uniref:Peptidoglycan DD-metalloendopeptidase family protein n=1 Tax=Anabaena lutea FACHB-196 TaxID=2692881 RepID=A0ABR8FD52_9NOST|nr:peptidoglycan DD-metalloendopeptidase family protein [Anabaena lutea]MBD2566859.1 peptidoglycan DD-metalloendopeptidase family protein [Anabaena lutea FACHB-196]